MKTLLKIMMVGVVVLMASSVPVVAHDLDGTESICYPFICG